MSATVTDEVERSGGASPPPRRYGPRPWPLGRARTVALIAALCFLAGAIGWWIGDPGKPSFSATDAGFLDDMSIHHDGAINLGFAYLGPGNDATVGHIAQEIVTNQSQEVAVMNGLVGQAGHRASFDDNIVMDWMGPGIPVAKMPGMATPDEVAALRADTGVVADEDFTRLMIKHHAAGIDMADYEAKNGSNATVKRLAAAMAQVQRTEITELNTRREELGFEPVDVPLPSAAPSAHSG